MASRQTRVVPRHTAFRAREQRADRFTIPCAGRRALCYRGRPLVMGILNITPDSFSDGGRFLDPDSAVRRGLEMAEQGADLLDLGGESTRPGAVRVPAAEELRRVAPVIERLAHAVRVPLSIDTSKADVAAEALAAGASIINDVSALRGDPDMIRVAARWGAAVILMHRQGSPRTMQRRPRYQKVVEDVSSFLIGAAGRAQTAGIPRDRILIDPGLGFGKTAAHNLALLRALNRFVSLGYPVVLGPSRKSFIGKSVGGEAHERLGGTLAAVSMARTSGVHLVRVHDVQPTVQFLSMLDLLEAPSCV